MSTYYYVACDRCRSFVAFASVLATGGVCSLAGDENRFRWFARHENHYAELRIANEHDGRLEDYDEAGTDARGDVDGGKQAS